MRWIHAARERLRSLFRGGRVEAEMDEEIRFHLEKEVEKNLRMGMSAREARTAAHVAFGGVERTKERTRDARGTRLLEDLVRDVGFAFRTLRKNPGYSLVVMLTLALGIGANSAIFSLVNGVLLEPIPYGKGEQLVHIRQDVGSLPGQADLPFSVKEIEDYRSRTRTMTDVVEYHSMSFILLGRGDPEVVRTGVVSAHFFGLMGMEPILGRGFTEADNALGAEPVLVLSHGFWQRRFGGDPKIIGQTFEMNDRVHTVVGVLPPVPQFPQENDVYMPTSACPTRSDPDFIANRRSRMMLVFGRLRGNATVERATADVRRVARTLASDHPEAYRNLGGFTADVAPLKEELVRDARPTLLILLAATGFILLIACANVANLALARATHRENEMAVRAAMGAGRGRLARQLLTESTVLALAGGVLGLGVAYAGLGLLVDFAARFTPRAYEAAIDGPVLLFTLTAAGLTGIVFGSFPALLSRPNPAETVKDGVAHTSGRRRHRLQGGLVTAQVSVAFVLLVGAGLMIRSFFELRAVDPGYSPERVLALRTSVSFAEYRTKEARKALFDALMERVAGMPEVVSVARATDTPMSDGGRFSSSFRIAGRRYADGADVPRAQVRTVSPGYFRTLGIPLVAGRTFDGRDHPEAAFVGVINEAFAQRHFPGEDPLGRQLIQCFDSGQCNAPMTVVGVVGNVRQHGLGEPVAEEVYRSGDQVSFGGGDLLVRTRGNPLGLVERVKAAVWELDPRIPVRSVGTLNELVGESIAPHRLTTLLMGGFAAVALAVTLAGVFGVMASSVGRRTREIGIRIALGADRRSVLGMVMSRGMTLVAGGLLVGAAVTIPLNRAVAGAVWGVPRGGPGIYGAVAALLAAVALAACYLPARRAASVDPVGTFRRG